MAQWLETIAAAVGTSCLVGGLLIWLAVLGVAV